MNDQSRRFFFTGGSADVRSMTQHESGVEKIRKLVSPIIILPVEYLLKYHPCKMKFYFILSLAVDNIFFSI